MTTKQIKALIASLEALPAKTLIVGAFHQSHNNTCCILGSLGYRNGKYDSELRSKRMLELGLLTFVDGLSMEPSYEADQFVEINDGLDENPEARYVRVLKRLNDLLEVMQ